MELVEIHVSSPRNSCKYDDTPAGVVGGGLAEVGRFGFETWVICSGGGGRGGGGGVGAVGGAVKDRDT